MAKMGKTSDATLAGKLIAGIGKHLATVVQLMFASGTFTPAQVVAQLQTLIALRQGVSDARATLKARLAAEASQAPTLREFMLAFVAFVKATFSKSPDVLADFGLASKKAATPLTVEQKVAKAAKGKATRQARGTMGKKRKPVRAFRFYRRAAAAGTAARRSCATKWRLSQSGGIFR